MGTVVRRCLYFFCHNFGYVEYNVYLCRLLNHQDNEESIIHGVGTAGSGDYGR
jgi:hypothetical protein